MPKRGEPIFNSLVSASHTHVIKHVTTTYTRAILCAFIEVACSVAAFSSSLRCVDATGARHGARLWDSAVFSVVGYVVHYLQDGREVLLPQDSSGALVNRCFHIQNLASAPANTHTQVSQPRNTTGTDT